MLYNLSNLYQHLVIYITFKIFKYFTGIKTLFLLSFIIIRL